MDLRPVFLVGWALLSMPAIMGAVFAFLAGCSGVEAAGRLGVLRYLLAAGLSAVCGWLVLAVILLLGLASFGLLDIIPFTPDQVLTILCIIAAATVLGAFAAYRVGRFLGAILTTDAENEHRTL